MKKTFFKCFVFYLLLCSYSAFAQVGINTTNPHPSAALDIISSTRGLLIPRIDSAARVGMTGMANSLLVFDTSKQLFFYYQASNSTWYALNAWQSSIIENGGNTDTLTTTFSKVGIGTNNPTKKLEVVGDVKVSDSLYVGTSVKAGSSVSAPKIYGEGTMPPGAIIMWSGNPKALPVGWALCDGQNGTPDLKGRFVVGYDAADSRYNNLSPANRIGGNDTVIIQNKNLPVYSPWSLLQTPHYHGYQDRSGYNSSLYTGNSSNSKDVWQADAGRTTDGSLANVSLEPNGGGGQAIDTRPPYYMLAYIIKLNY